MRSSRTRAVTTLIAITALAMSACGGAATTPSPRPSQTSLPTSAPSPSTKATPTGQPSPSSLAVLPESGAFGPGTYATAFQPPLTFTLVDLTIVGAGGTIAYESIGEVDAYLPGWIDIAFGFDKPGRHGSGTWSADWAITRIDKVFDPKHPGTVVDPPTDFAAWITKLPGLTLVAPPKPIKIGGLDATQLDVLSGDKEVAMGPIPSVDDPHVGFGPAQRARLTVLRVDGHDILIFIGGADSGDHYDRAVQQLQPLTDSIVWH